MYITTEGIRSEQAVVSGVCIARSYIDRPENTEHEADCAHPYSEKTLQRLLYKLLELLHGGGQMSNTERMKPLLTLSRVSICSCPAKVRRQIRIRFISLLHDS